MSFLDDLKKELPEGVLQVTSEPTGFLSTGWIPLDYAMGGGIAMPKITVLAGEPSSGKTLLALNAAKQIQQEGGVVLYGNSEDAPILERARQVGIKEDGLLLLNVECLQSFYWPGKPKRKENKVFGFFDIVISLLEKAAAKDPERKILIVLDSVGATPTKSQLLGQDTLGAHARAMSLELRKVNRVLSRSNASLLLINHLTRKVGVEYGKDTTFLADQQQTYYAVTTVELVRAKYLEKKGQLVRAHVTKNKLTGQRVRTVEFPVYYSGGIPVVEGAVEFLASISSRPGYVEIDGKMVGRNKLTEVISTWPKRKQGRLIRLARKKMAEMTLRLRRGEDEESS